VSAIRTKHDVAIGDKIVTDLDNKLTAPLMANRWRKRWGLDVPVKAPRRRIASNGYSVQFIAARAPMPNRAHSARIRFC
jgi:hypothetical protein